MYYDEEFVQSLPGDRDSALLNIATSFYRLWERAVGDLDNPVPYGLIRETHAFLSAYFARENLSQTYTDPRGGPISLPSITGNETEDTKKFVAFISALHREMTERVNKDQYARARDAYSLMLGTAGFHYEFSDGDLARIQKLVNELRDLIAASEELVDEHKRRVLGRLEKLQSELHKKVSDLAWFWGELIEASIAARIIGENAKPIVDRISEIVRIVWPVQSRAFELPSDTPFRLPGQVEDDKPK